MAVSVPVFLYFFPFFFFNFFSLFLSCVNLPLFSVSYLVFTKLAGRSMLLLFCTKLFLFLMPALRHLLNPVQNCTCDIHCLWIELCDGTTFSKQNIAMFSARNIVLRLDGTWINCQRKITRIIICWRLFIESNNTLVLVTGRALCGDAGGINHSCWCGSWTFLGSFIILLNCRGAKREYLDNHSVGSSTVLCINEE